MSLVFSDTLKKHGIMQRIEKELRMNYGDITGSPTVFSGFVSDVNLTLDKVVAIILEVGGTWQFDDSNYTDFPIMTTQLNSGQRDYNFATDEHAYLVLEVEKAEVADSNGNYREIQPVDQSTRGMSPAGYSNGQNATGIPNTYDKLGSSIILDPIPSYTKAAGLRLYISREASYFTAQDTTKKPGFAGLFHEYLVIWPAYEYAARYGLEMQASLLDRCTKMEDAIRNFYKGREKDVQKTLKPRRNNAH